MLIEEMHYGFDLRVDRVASQDRPDFYPNEKDDYINRAIMFFTKDRYGIDEKKYGFETNQERISNLMNLHVKSPELQPPLIPILLQPGYYEVRLNSLLYRYLFLTNARILIEKDNCTKTIDATAWQIDDKKTVYSDPSFDWGRVLINFGKSTVSPTSTNAQLPSMYIDTRNKKGIPQFEVKEVNINYIKYPNRVCLGTYKHIDDKTPSVLTPVQHCDIDDAFHDEILNIAVMFATRDIQDQFGFQTSQQQIIIDK